jgi:hypothetical protein
MNKEIKAKWVAALRSGKYKQTTGALRRGDSFCCLGVLCNLHAEAHPKTAAKQKSINYYMGEGGVLPQAVLRWAGLGKYNVDVAVKYKDIKTNLADLNDRKGLSFKQIANVIERCL